MKEKYLQELKDVCENGQAPPSYKHKSLAKRLAYHYGSWLNACIAAGVQPRRLTETRRKNTYKCDKVNNKQIQELAVCILIAKEKGNVQKMNIEGVLESVRRGFVKNYRVI